MNPPAANRNAYKTRFSKIGRRAFLAAGVATAGTLLAGRRMTAEAEADAPGPDADGLPRADLHVHLDGSTIAQVAALSRERGVRFGIVEHAGTKENVYPVVLSNDKELQDYLEMLAGHGVYCGVQAEWIDWSQCFSAEALARLDYVLMDAMTYPGRDGSRVKLWEADAPQRVDMDDRESFMDRFVDWHVQIIEEQPIHILGNASWLPPRLADDYEKFWSKRRVRKVAEAAVRRGVAIEISGGFRVPRRVFLEVARECGAKFAFGTNGRYPHMGKIEYCLEMARSLELRRDDIFLPAAK